MADRADEMSKALKFLRSGDIAARNPATRRFVMFHVAAGGTLEQAIDRIESMAARIFNEPFERRGK